MKFKAASRETVVKRLRKRIELQEESSKRVNMEAWRNALYKRSEYDELTRRAEPTGHPKIYGSGIF